jgi:hypothetical protein
MCEGWDGKWGSCGLSGRPKAMARLLPLCSSHERPLGVGWMAGRGLEEKPRAARGALDVLGGMGADVCALVRG